MKFATTLYYWKGEMLYKLMGSYPGWSEFWCLHWLTLIGVTGATWAVKDSTSVQERFCTWTVLKFFHHFLYMLF